MINGIGVNDAPYQVRQKDINGKVHLCPYYTRWTNMLKRVYCPKFKEIQPTYTGCTVEPSWLYFTNFRSWMLTQNWRNKELDKDLLVQGNKHYGPHTCLFVSKEINNLLLIRQNYRGELPLGVSKVKRGNNTYIQAQCSFYGVKKRIGYFKTVEDAAEAYKVAKLAYIKELANNELDPEIKAALLRIH